MWLRILDGRTDQPDQGQQEQQPSEERPQDCLSYLPANPNLAVRPAVRQRRHLRHSSPPPRKFTVRRILQGRNYDVKRSASAGAM
jgi:hypothetical protein